LRKLPSLIEIESSGNFQLCKKQGIFDSKFQDFRDCSVEEYETYLVDLLESSNHQRDEL